jgi:hypothetical protein
VDLGTVSVRVAAPLLDGGRLVSVRVLENADGAWATPAWVALEDDDGGRTTVIGAPVHAFGRPSPLR